MRHVDYKDWAGYLHCLFAKADININNVLDISCGTANLAIELTALGYDVSGIDSSYQMVKVAKKKLAKLNRNILLWTSSMSEFMVKTQYDAIVCTYDSINYCPNLKSVIKVLTKVENVLTCGGVFIFDISTVRNSKRYFQKYYDNDGTEEFNYSRQSYYLIQKRQQTNEFCITFNADKKTCYKEVHQQKIYKIDELKNVIMSTSLSLTGIYNGFTLQPGTEKSDRVHFVLTKI